MEMNGLEMMVNEQAVSFAKRDMGVLRDVNFKKYLATGNITVISGPRRAGKSTLLAQFATHFTDYYYLNFEDERLNSFTIDDFQTLMVVFQKRYPSKTVLLDEIQNVRGWEKFVRRIHDEGFKIFITGSNAGLLSSELATHLTGRYLKIELFPFSFREYLAYYGFTYENTTYKRARVLKFFDEHVKDGGFPLYIKEKDVDVLQQLYSDILHKDLIARFKIRDIKTFKELAGYLLSNVGKEVSYVNLQKSLGIKSQTSVKNYIDFLQEGYLIFEIYRYDHSRKKQFVHDKKIFCIDNGLKNAVGFAISEDFGRALENIVLLELKRKKSEVYFFKAKKECDFVVKEKNCVTQVIQVTADYKKPGTKSRELEGLMEAMEVLKVSNGLILTYDTEEKIKIGRSTVRVMPIWKWLLLL